MTSKKYITSCAAVALARGGDVGASDNRAEMPVGCSDRPADRHLDGPIVDHNKLGNERPGWERCRVGGRTGGQVLAGISAAWESIRITRSCDLMAERRLLSRPRCTAAFIDCSSGKRRRCRRTDAARRPWFIRASTSCAKQDV